MTTIEKQIYVKSHVARDLLQSAALFKTDKLVVWEYVSNSLQYVDPGINPLVRVTLDNRRKRIVLADNGRGMDWAGLQNFFIMHGENIDRKIGLVGRGRFGTGKSAAFGIANSLRITTVRNGKRSQVALSRSDLDSISSEEPVPVQILEQEVPTTEPNGTVIEIDEVLLKTLDQAGIIQFIERHLARWPRNVTVFVNNHECEFMEPPVARELCFSPEGATRDVLGDIELIVKVSSTPLDEDLRGISIYSNGVWHETTLAGNEGRDMAQYIFGEIDVPKLDEDKSPIPPLDQSRSMKLNPNNELVRTVYSFIGQKVDIVRRELLEEDKRRKRSEEARKLSSQAAEIAQVINEDFAAFREKLLRIRARMRGQVDIYQGSVVGEDPESLILGSELPAHVIAETGSLGSTGEGPGSGGLEPRKLAPQVAPGGDDLHGQRAKATRDPAGSTGGFHVEFREMSEDEYRAKYVRDERTIYINLDHPQLVAARGSGGIEEAAFRRLAYEIAFSEYSIALAQEMIATGQLIDLTDPVQNIRETLDRISRKGSSLYSE